MQRNFKRETNACCLNQKLCRFLSLKPGLKIKISAIWCTGTETCPTKSLIWLFIKMTDTVDSALLSYPGLLRDSGFTNRINFKSCPQWLHLIPSISGSGSYDKLIKVLKKRQEQSHFQMWADMSRGDYIKTESLMRGRFDSSKAHFIKYFQGKLMDELTMFTV